MIRDVIFLRSIPIYELFAHFRSVSDQNAAKIKKKLQKKVKNNPQNTEASSWATDFLNPIRLAQSNQKVPPQVQTLFYYGQGESSHGNRSGVRRGSR